MQVTYGITYVIAYSIFGHENNYSNNFLLHFLVTLCNNLWNKLACNRALRMKNVWYFQAHEFNFLLNMASLSLSLFPFISTFLERFLKTLVFIIFLLKFSNCVIHFLVSLDFKIISRVTWLWNQNDFKVTLSHEIILKSLWDNF